MINTNCAVVASSCAVLRSSHCETKHKASHKTTDRNQSWQHRKIASPSQDQHKTNTIWPSRIRIQVSDYVHLCIRMRCDKNVLLSLVHTLLVTGLVTGPVTTVTCLVTLVTGPVNGLVSCILTGHMSGHVTGQSCVWSCVWPCICPGVWKVAAILANTVHWLCASFQPGTVLKILMVV